MQQTDKLNKLHTKIQALYKKHKKKLLFHGWHHINFVAKKSVEFARKISADEFITESSALVHDLNYIIKPNSEPEIATDYRQKLLSESGYTPGEIEKIEKTIMEAHTRTRTENISEEGKALSDADSLFKILPVTPVLFASKYITQNKVDVGKWAQKVTSEQIPLLEKDIYFYTDFAKQKYLKWAKNNLELCSYVNEALKDPEVREMLDIARKNGVI